MADDLDAMLDDALATMESHDRQIDEMKERAASQELPSEEPDLTQNLMEVINIVNRTLTQSTVDADKMSDDDIRGMCQQLQACAATIGQMGDLTPDEKNSYDTIMSTIGKISNNTELEAHEMEHLVQQAMSSLASENEKSEENAPQAVDPNTPEGFAKLFQNGKYEVQLVALRDAMGPWLMRNRSQLRPDDVTRHEAQLERLMGLGEIIELTDLSMTDLADPSSTSLSCNATNKPSESPDENLQRVHEFLRLNRELFELGDVPMDLVDEIVGRSAN